MNNNSFKIQDRKPDLFLPCVSVDLRQVRLFSNIISIALLTRLVCVAFCTFNSVMVNADSGLPSKKMKRTKRRREGAGAWLLFFPLLAMLRFLRPLVGSYCCGLDDVFHPRQAI